MFSVIGTILKMKNFDKKYIFMHCRIYFR